MTKRFGFTLAEVLITLGIIGVVAAMTIPTLIANTNSAKFRSQFKKSLSTLNQAALMGQAQYDMHYGDATAACSATLTSTHGPAAQDADVDPTICAILNGTLSGKQYVPKVADLKSSKGAYSITPAATTSGLTTLGWTAGTAAAPGDTIIGYTLADGSLFAFPNTAANCTDNSTHACHGFIDVNGATLPNKEVSCDANGANAAANTTCTVPNTAANMTDVFPVIFYNSTVEPSTDAGRYVLTTSK